MWSGMHQYNELLEKDSPSIPDKRSFEETLQRIFNYFVRCDFSFIAEDRLRENFIKSLDDFTCRSRRRFSGEKWMVLFLDIYTQYSASLNSSSRGEFRLSNKLKDQWHATVFCRLVSVLLECMEPLLRSGSPSFTSMGHHHDGFRRELLSDSLLELEDLCVNKVGCLCFKYSYLDGYARRLVLSLCDILTYHNILFGLEARVLSLRKAASGLNRSGENRASLSVSFTSFSCSFDVFHRGLRQPLVSRLSADERLELSIVAPTRTGVN